MSTAKFARFAMAVAILFSCATSARADEGFALRFDGTTDFVALPATSSVLPAGWQTTKTVELWVKPTGTAFCTAPAPVTCDAIFGDGVNSRWWGISRGTVGGQDRIWVWNWDGNIDSVGIPYTVGDWVHIALVHSGGRLWAYKNGVLINSVVSGATVQPATGAPPTLFLGGMIKNATNNFTFQGEIDEVRVWSIARTASELLDNKDFGLVGSEIGLAAYYRISTGIGTTLNDDTGHGKTGTLQDGGSGVAGNGPIEWVTGVVDDVASGSPNTPPVANPQSLTTAEDTALAITLTGSDPDEGSILTFQVLAAPAHGTLSGTSPNLTYTPAANYYGPDAFTFVANDGRANSAPQSVTITITAVNDPPIANNDAITTSGDAAVSIDVLSNDVDVDLVGLYIVDVGLPAHGTTAIDLGQVIYTPTLGFVGTDSFEYMITDNDGGLASAQVTVTVRAPGSDPGYALRFDGRNDFVSLTYTSSILPAGWQTTKTIELWIKPTGTGSCGVPVSVVSCDLVFGDGPRWWGISRGTINGQDRIWVWNWDTGGADVVAVPYTVGEWMHLAMVHGGGQLSAYKNGVLVGAVPSGATQQPQLGAQPVILFGGMIKNATSNLTFEGEIDEVRIWSTVRTAAELAGNWNVTLQGWEAGLEAYYRMTDGSGTRLTDDTGHGWTGTLNDGRNPFPPDGPILWVPSGIF